MGEAKRCKEFEKARLENPTKDAFRDWLFSENVSSWMQDVAFVSSFDDAVFPLKKEMFNLLRELLIDTQSDDIGNMTAVTIGGDYALGLDDSWGLFLITPFYLAVYPRNVFNRHLSSSRIQRFRWYAKKKWGDLTYLDSSLIEEIKEYRKLKALSNSSTPIP